MDRHATDRLKFTDIHSQARISAKLEMPRRASDQLERTKTSQKIADADWARLTLLQAPSGFGKTIVMSDAFRKLHKTGVRCSWMTIDEADNDVGRFLFCLKEAGLKMLETEVPAPVASASSTEELLAAVLEIFGRIRDPFAFFLDDAELLTDAPILDLLRELINALPVRGRIIMASRAVPEMGLPRLRARGRLLELGHRELRFTLEETQSFLKMAIRPDLGHLQVQQLHRKTEGWPAAIRLAAIFLERNRGSDAVIEQLSGANSALSEFLASEVLSTQPEHIQDFLLTTSIVKDLTPDLCDAIRGADDSFEILQDLARRSVLITRIEGANDIYRCHGLFSSFLKAALVQSRGGEIADLHETAMTWFLDRGRIVPAVDHAIAGQDFLAAVKMIVGLDRKLLEQGRLRLLCRWFEAIPEDLMRMNTEVILQHAWACLFLKGPQAARNLVDQFETELTGSLPVITETQCLRVQIASMLDDFESAIQIGEQAMKQMHLAPSYARTVLLNGMAYAYFVVGRFGQSRKTLHRARSEHSESDDIFNVMFAETVQGMIDMMENRLREAKARLRVAASTTRQGTRHKTNGNLIAGIPLARCLYESNETQKAATQLRFHLPFVRDIGPIDHMILCHTLLARIAFGEGDLDQAFAFLADLEELGRRRGLPRVTAGAGLERTRIYMQQGQYARARRELSWLSDDDLWDRVRNQKLPANDLETPTLHLIRLELLDGNPTRAQSLISPEIARCKEQGRYQRAMLLGLLNSAAQLQKGERLSAMSQAGRILPQCAREGYLRLVIDEGPALSVLLRTYAEHALHGERAMTDPLFVDWLQELILLMPERDCPVSGETSNRVPFDLLTPKELEILGLLSDGHSNAAMSEKLGVSDSTVRTHLRNINSKLSTSSRGSGRGNGPPYRITRRLDGFAEWRMLA